jgi:hypothetical protein
VKEAGEDAMNKMSDIDDKTPCKGHEQTAVQRIKLPAGVESTAYV